MNWLLDERPSLADSKRVLMTMESASSVYLLEKGLVDPRIDDSVVMILTSKEEQALGAKRR